jgi:hypothetical protein
VRLSRRIKRNHVLHAPGRPSIAPSEIWQDDSGTVHFWFDWEVVSDMQSGFLSAANNR